MHIGEMEQESDTGFRTIKRWLEWAKIAIAVIGAAIGLGIGWQQISINTLAIETQRKVNEAQDLRIVENEKAILRMEGKLDVLGVKLDDVVRRLNDMQKGK